MTDTLTQRVAEAIRKAVYPTRLFTMRESELCAKAAIEASGAQHLQGLVEALKYYYTVYGGNVARDALAALQPELRGEK